MPVGIDSILKIMNSTSLRCKKEYNTAISLYKTYKVEKKLSNLEKDFQ